MPSKLAVSSQNCPFQGPQFTIFVLYLFTGRHTSQLSVVFTVLPVLRKWVYYAWELYYLILLVSVLFNKNKRCISRISVKISNCTGNSESTRRTSIVHSTYILKHAMEITSNLQPWLTPTKKTLETEVLVQKLPRLQAGWCLQVHPLCVDCMEWQCLVFHTSMHILATCKDQLNKQGTMVTSGFYNTHDI